MSKHFKLVFLTFVLILSGLFLLVFKIRDLDSLPHSETSFFMRNLSWQTDFRPSVPYKKGDDMEFTWVFSGDSPRTVGFDISGVKNSLDIEHIFLDDKEIQEADLKNIHVQSSSLLKITGKALKLSTDDVFVEPKITTKEESTQKNIDVSSTGSAVPEKEPSLIRADQTEYNSNINNLLTLHGESLDNIEFVNI